MEFGIETANAIRECSPCDRGDRFVEQRLEYLLRLNAEIALDKDLYRDDGERQRAELMKNPLDSRKALGYFGLMIGSLPPLSLAIKVLLSEGAGMIVFSVLMAVAGILTGIVGLALGRRFACGALRKMSSFALPNRVALWSVLGLAWGIISGAAGGVVFLLVGSIPGAIIGGMVGAVTVPSMIALHSTVRMGDFIEAKHFLPIAFGITLSLCAFIAGL